MLLLIEKFKKYTLTKELNTTNNILLWANRYNKDTDLYLQFINEFTIITNNNNNCIHCISLYGYFKNWYKNNNPNVSIPNYKAFVGNLKKYMKIENFLINGKNRLGIKNIKMKMKIN